ncbi:hypothetical protein AAG570_009627 [Ranatra chinensis]|uniref:ALMS motif domain-containing protein n=1 Tax=Ranatra chinensis TaxID=642074 RepID=A0ABD0Z2M0_9HEMI
MFHKNKKQETTEIERERLRDGRQQRRGVGRGNVMVSLEELHSALDRILTGGEESGQSPPTAKPQATNQRDNWEAQRSRNQPPPMRVIEGGDSSSEDQPVTLQDYLASNRPGYLMRAENRRKVLAELAELRENRTSKKRELIAQAVASECGKGRLEEQSASASLPPPPLAVKRIVSQKDLHRQTRKKYYQLNEIRNKKMDLKKKEQYKTNRLMAQVFNKKLQAKTLKVYGTGTLHSGAIEEVLRTRGDLECEDLCWRVVGGWDIEIKVL